MRRPGIEPGASRWQRDILPLNQRRFMLYTTHTLKQKSPKNTHNKHNTKQRTTHKQTQTIAYENITRTLHTSSLQPNGNQQPFIHYHTLISSLHAHIFDYIILYRIHIIHAVLITIILSYQHIR